jgi:transposase
MYVEVMKMPAAYKFEPEAVTELRKAMKETKNKNAYRRLEAVALRAEGKSNNEIAEITKYHSKRVSQIVSLYCNEGIAAIAEDRRKGGNSRNMSFAEEEAFLEGFRDDAESGRILTVSEIKSAYDEKTGKESATSTVYFMLERHGWRKLSPRSAHPKKASEEAIEASKKLTSDTRGYWKNITELEGKFA